MNADPMQGKAGY